LGTPARRWRVAAPVQELVKHLSVGKAGAANTHVLLQVQVTDLVQHAGSLILAEGGHATASELLQRTLVVSNWTADAPGVVPVARLLGVVGLDAANVVRGAPHERLHQ